ncbi:MOSC domain protein [Variibacter gotjawalensis]|uniref:MOSC domain protein n=1 Tax=Variibacter gotjawalensis TaxID=1333996 RepID=A0A0S3PU75_9BRAD|nr:MOSC domain-containing protein [Variibacter gotjawalensis]NIK49826.1 hypothetical protein [Variibacter gotjawalensis]RZS45828.1 hypothetical protein EV661_4153 [Variibacter gotjawalensis]BAT59503.1 MOSC domain protein [Variibacter gotjawalensis]
MNDGLNPVGRVLELWRYPVSSIGGERITSAKLDCAGLKGDRQFALIDQENGFAAAPEMDKRWRNALFLSSAIAETGLPEITFPSGNRVSLHDRGINQLLTDYFGFAVAIAAIEPSSVDAKFPRTQHRHPHAAVHVVTTGSMQHLAALCGSSTIESRRFRPTAVVATYQDDHFDDNKWIGKRLQIGPSVELIAEEQTKRCGMTFVAQPGLDANPDILRSILRNNRRNFGVNCAVVRSGEINVGDALSFKA